MRLNWNIRRARVYVGPASGEQANFVANCVFDFQRNEVEAREGAFDCRYIDANRARGLKPIGPTRRESDPINILLVTVRSAGDSPENSAGGTTLEIGAIAEKPFAAEEHTTTHRTHSLRVEGFELIG